MFSSDPDGGHRNTGLSAVIAKVPCILQDTAAYDAKSNTLKMSFAVANSSAATWNTWLTYRNTMEQLFSVSQPITDRTKMVPKSTSLPKNGIVGILSTLTTPETGIGCSSWVQVDTGIGP